MSDLHFVFPPIATMASQLACGGAEQIVCAASCPSSVSRRTDLAATNVNTLEQGSLDASAQGVLTRAQEMRDLIELEGASQRGGLYEGVYESGAGFGAELRKGNKRLRQTGFSSAFEAALERAKWAKADMEGLHDNAPQRPCAELNPAEMVTHQQEMECLRYGAQHPLAEMVLHQQGVATELAEDAQLTPAEKVPHQQEMEGAEDETPQCPSAQQQPPAEMVPHQQGEATEDTELAAEGEQLAPAEMEGAEDETPQCPRAQQQPPAEMVLHQQGVATELAEGAQLTPAEMMVPQQGVATHEANQELANATNAECAPPAALSLQDSLRKKFELHVMCDYTPVEPVTLDKLYWVSYKTLLRQLEMHAPTEVRELGAINLKQLITEWVKDHPVFRGLPYSDWCKKLKDYDPLASGRNQVFKFCFKHTPSKSSGIIGGLSTVRETGCSLIWQGGGSGWEVRPSVRHEHVAGHGQVVEVLALQSSIQGFHQNVAKQQQQLEQQQQVLLPATIQSANISMPSKENDTVLLRVTWEEPPTRTCHEGQPLPPFTVRLDAENGAGAVPDGIRLRASFLDGSGVVEETKTNGTSALVAGERYAYVAGGRAVWEQLFVCEASSTHHRSFTILIDAIEVTVSGLNFVPCAAHIPHPACISITSQLTLKSSFTLSILQAPPHVRVPELRSEPLQVTMRRMSRWQNRDNDARSPSDSISHLPGVGCTPHMHVCIICTFPCTFALHVCIMPCGMAMRRARSRCRAFITRAARSSQVGIRYTARLQQHGITSIRQFSEMAASPAGRAALFSLCKGDDPHNPFNDKKLQARRHAL